MNNQNQVPHAEDVDKHVAGLIVAGVLLVAILIFILQNSEHAKVTWLFADGDAPVWVVILTSAVGGALVERIITYVVRRRRAHPGH